MSSRGASRSDSKEGGLCGGAECLLRGTMERNCGGQADGGAGAFLSVGEGAREVGRL